MVWLLKKQFSICDDNFFLFFGKRVPIIFYVLYMETFGNQIQPKTSQKYYCETCDYNTAKRSNFNSHMNSIKHQSGHGGNHGNQNKPEISQNICKLCDTFYSNRSGLWKHQKKYHFENITTNNLISQQSNPPDEPTDKELIMMLLKKNDELQNMMMEVIKNGTHNTTNNNSHNKAFNLNFFLNETCKDAMNITEFVDSIKLQLSDLEKVGEIGYVEGISNIIVKNLNELDITQRPVHCTDKKRETMYIKDEDKWEKDEENSKIKKAIKRVASKNQRLITKFKEEHPDCTKYHSRYSDQYNKIIVESMGGSGDNDLEKEEKIVRNISKNVVVNK